MNEIVNIQANSEDPSSENELIKISEELLLDKNADISKYRSISVPIAQLSSLGAGVSSLIPALRTVTQTTTVDVQGLYQVANAGVGDVLKAAKNGRFWGALKTAEGTSKMAQLQAAGPLSATTTAVAAINPATMMVAASLLAIEEQLDNIAEVQKQILSFLEIEKEAEIEANIQTLSDIATKYKYNWDNEHYVASNHKLVLDIKMKARKNMISFQKTITEVLESKPRIVVQNKVNETLDDLIKKFNYYRLSLYAFSMSSLFEVLLSGNFKEEYISDIKIEIESCSLTYRKLYEKGSVFLEKMAQSSVEANMLNGIGGASNVIGKFIGKIPVVEKGPVDEYLQDRGMHLKENAKSKEMDAVGSFAALSNPGTGIFAEKLGDMIQIYNYTEKIYFDDKCIYLCAQNDPKSQAVG